MPPLEKQNKINFDKIIYLFIAASPGGFKIFILLILGILPSNIQGVIANDLSIVGFLTMITAIGAGTQLLHVIPKKISSSDSEARTVLKSALIKLLPYIFFICITFYLIDSQILKSSSSDFETAILLFSSSIYWIFRHYYLAREATNKLILMEAWTWLSTTILFITLYNLGNLTAENALISISISYTISFSTSLTKVMLHKENNKISIIRDSASIGLSNLISGGIINLVPSICYNLGNAALAGTMGLMINISSVTLTLIRAQLYKKSPQISSAISEKNPNIITICKNTQLTITKLILASSLALQPINVISSYYTQHNTSLISTFGYSILITALIGVPQLSAINSIVANFIGKSRGMLIANTAHATLSISITYIFHIVFNNASITFIAFLISSSLLFVGRNIVINRMTFDELNKTINLAR
ncbi:hypothetical protein [Pseudomonas helleri]|uniref:hypothetical protein n=1 Tax=Pseudomonas helleri TaxID=1608996 RepID=UPI003FD5FD47